MKSHVKRMLALLLTAVVAGCLCAGVETEATELEQEEETLVEQAVEETETGEVKKDDTLSNTQEEETIDTDEQNLNVEPPVSASSFEENATEILENTSKDMEIMESDKSEESEERKEIETKESILVEGTSEDLHWSIDSGGCFTLEGVGDYYPTEIYGESFPLPPWITYRKDIKKANIKVKNITNLREIFYLCENMTSVNWNNIDTSQVVDMRGMFCGCSSLQQVDVSHFDTSRVTDMSYMFSECSSLQQVDVSHFDTSQVTDMSYMFFWCDSLQKLDISRFDCDSIDGSGSVNMLLCGGARVIQSPKNLKIEIKLPERNGNSCDNDRWKGSDGKLYNNLPMNVSNSITLTRIAGPGHRNKEEVAKKATLSRYGFVKTECTVCGNISTIEVPYPDIVKLSVSSYTYNGKVKKPSVRVKDIEGKVITPSNYTVSYTGGRKNVGRYKVTITFKENYSGSVKKTFDILPQGTSISKVTSTKKGFTVKWKKQKVQTSGYQIQYSTNKSFGKNTKIVTVKKNSAVSQQIKKLKTKQKYYVRIRTYKAVKINGKLTKLYSKWSKDRTIKTKK